MKPKASKRNTYVCDAYKQPSQKASLGHGHLVRYTCRTALGERTVNWDWFSAVMGFIGGTAAVGAAFTWAAQKLLGYFADKRLKAWQNELDHSLENARASLRREEYLYDHQMNAARDYLKLYNDIMPSRRHPDMDFSEALDDLAASMGTIEPKLTNFMNEHQAVLPVNVSTQVWKVINLANEATYETHYVSDGTSQNLEQQHEKVVEKVWDELGSAHEMIRNLVWVKPGQEGSP